MTMRTGNETLADSLRDAERRGTVDDLEAAVLRMRHGISEPPDAPIEIRTGLEQNSSALEQARELEQWAATHGFTRPTPPDMARLGYGHGARLGNDAVADVLRLQAQGGEQTH